MSAQQLADGRPQRSLELFDAISDAESVEPFFEELSVVPTELSARPLPCDGVHHRLSSELAELCWRISEQPSSQWIRVVQCVTEQPRGYPVGARALRAVEVEHECSASGRLLSGAVSGCPGNTSCCKVEASHWSEIFFFAALYTWSACAPLRLAW